MARLPYSADRLEGREINVRDTLPVRFEHPVREINDHMDDIVYNAINVIQERARDSGLRTFYFNLMSEDNYRNRQFEDIISMIADIIDISVCEARFRDVRDAVIPVVEDIMTLHMGYLTEDYPELMDTVRPEHDRDIARAVDMFSRYMEAVKKYRRNGNQVPRDGGRGGRDDRDRGGRDRGVNFGADRGDRGRPRRDEYNRGAMRGGVHGSPRRSVNRENRFGNSDQSDRFDDAAATPRDVRSDNNDSSRDNDRRHERFDDMPQGRTSRRDEVMADKPRSSVQRLPGHSSSQHRDVEDALARENQTQGTSKMAPNPKFDSMLARENLDIWLPTVAHPHPLVFNYSQDLYYTPDTDAGVIIPEFRKKETAVDYYAHNSLAMGPVPKDFARFEDGTPLKRLDVLHNALLNPKEDFVINEGPESVTYHNRIVLESGQPFLSYAVKDSMIRLGYRRYLAERQQPADDGYHPVEIAVAQSMVIESFVASPEDADLFEELRSVSSFTKLAEKMRTLSKKVRPELWLQMDRYLTRAVIDMLRQKLSIPTVEIDSFTSDWMELFSWVTEQYGDGYRDAINTHQAREIKHLLNSDASAEIYVLSQLDDAPANALKPFVVAVPTKIIYLNEVGYNLNVDMVPGVASQILPEVNSFFHDLAQDLLNSGNAPDEFGKFYIQTSDMRVIEASRSFMNDKAILLRMIK